jgi:AraC-like DNA-binding protein
VIATTTGTSADGGHHGGRVHKLVGQLAHDSPDIMEHAEVCRALEEQLIHIMIRCLAAGAGVDAQTGDCRRHVIIKRFEDFLAAHPDRPLFLTEICASIGAAERTLRAACEEHLGMGPIRFLTLRRMHLARRALLSADAGKKRHSYRHRLRLLGTWTICGRLPHTIRGVAFGDTAAPSRAVDPFA